MKQPEDVTSLKFWVISLSLQGAMKNKIEAVATLKRIPDDVMVKSFTSAMRAVFNDNPPYDIPDIPEANEILQVLKDFAEESDQDFSTPYVRFLDLFLQDVGIVNSNSEHKPETAQPEKDTSEKVTAINSNREKRGSPGSPLSTEGSTPAVSHSPELSHQASVKSASDDDVEWRTPLAHEVGTSILSHTFTATSSDPGRIGSGELMRLPGILPPPPSGEDGDTYGKWLDGEVWHPQAISLKLTLLETDLVDDLFEMQSEFYAMPSAARETYGSRTPFDLEASSANNDGYTLYRRGRDIGFQEWTFEAAKNALAETVIRYFDEYEPTTAEYLGLIGFEVKIDIQLAAAVSAALDIEKYYMEMNAPENASEGGPQNLRGSISDGSRLDRPVILESAVIKHFVTGTPIATSLVVGLRELRHAQLCRHLGVEISNEDFDRKYDFDCFFDLDEYFPERKPEMDLSPA